MHIQDFTAAVARRRDTAMVEVRGGSVRATRGLPLFGRLFYPARGADRNRAAVDAFVGAVEREWGRHYAELVRSLLAQPRLSGQPLRKYMITDALQAVHHEQGRIAAYNERVGDMEVLLHNLAGRAESLPRGLLVRAAADIHDALRREWPSTREPVPAFVLRELTDRALLAAANAGVAERLLGALEESAGATEPLASRPPHTASEASALGRVLDRLARDWGVSEQDGADVRQFVGVTLGRYAATRPGPVRAADLLDAVVRCELPGLETLLCLLSPAPPVAPDPRFGWYKVPPLQAAWLVAALPEDGLPLTLALQHAEILFTSIPPGTPPLPSEIWRDLFDEEAGPDLDARPELLHGRMEERLRRFFAEPGNGSAGSAGRPESFDLRNIDRLYRLGLHPESVERFFGPPRTFPAFFAADYVELPVPPAGPDLAAPPERVWDIVGEGDGAAWAARPLQRGSLLRLAGPSGVGHLRELGAALGTELPAWLPCAVAVRREGDALLLTRDFDVVIEIGQSGVRAGIRYRIEADGSARTDDVYFVQSVLADPPSAVRDAYLRGALLTGGPDDAACRGGLPGATGRLLDSCGLSREHVARVERFLAGALRQRFDEPARAPEDDFAAGLPESMARLNEIVAKRLVAGLAELLYVLERNGDRGRRPGAGLTAPASAPLLDAYRPEPEAAAWLVRLTGGGVPLALGLQHLDLLTRASGRVPPFSADAYWESVFGEPFPAGGEAPFPQLVRDRLEALFNAELAAAHPELRVLDPGFRREANALLDDLLVAGVHFDVVMSLAREYRPLRAADFAALPVLRLPAGPDAEQRCLRELNAALVFSGAEPVIRFPTVQLDGAVVTASPRRSARTGTGEGEPTDPALHPIARTVVRQARELCGTRVAQRLALYRVLGEPGRGLFHLLLRAAAGMASAVASAPLSAGEATVRRRDDGGLSVELSTPAGADPAVLVRWGIAPDGLARCEDARAARHAGSISL